MVAIAGAKVDAALARRAAVPHAFSRAMVLRRYHHTVSPWDDLVFRWHLLRVPAPTSLPPPPTPPAHTQKVPQVERAAV